MAIDKEKAIKEIAKIVVNDKYRGDAFAYLLEFPKWDAQIPFFEYIENNLRLTPIANIRRALEATAIIIIYCERFSRNTYNYLEINIKPTLQQMYAYPQMNFKDKLEGYIFILQRTIPGGLSKEDYKSALEDIKNEVERIGNNPQEQWYNIINKQLNNDRHYYLRNGLYYHDDNWISNLFNLFLANRDCKFSEVFSPDIPSNNPNRILEGHHYPKEYDNNKPYRNVMHTITLMYLYGNDDKRRNLTKLPIFENGNVPNFITYDINNDAEGLNKERFDTVVKFTWFIDRYFVEWLYLKYDYDCECPFSNESMESNGLSDELVRERIVNYMTNKYN